MPKNKPGSGRNWQKRQRRQFREFFERNREFFAQFYDESEQYGSRRQPSEDLPDYYATLGLKSQATTEEIKAAFRTIAKKHHPDKLAEDLPQNQRNKSVDLFRRANEAYSVLTDDRKRREYDEAVSCNQENDEDSAVESDQGEFVTLSDEDVQRFFQQLRSRSRMSEAGGESSSGRSSSRGGFHYSQQNVRRLSRFRVFMLEWGAMIYTAILFAVALFLTWLLAFKLDGAGLVAWLITGLLYLIADLIYWPLWLLTFVGLGYYLLCKMNGFMLSCPRIVDFFNLHRVANRRNEEN